MMATTPDYAELAAKAAGNWRKFQSFAWHDQPEYPENYCIVYTHNRNSRLLEESNAAAIEKELEPFMGKSVFKEYHNHWAVGWVEGYAIKVYDAKGRVTAGFKKWCDLKAILEDYPVLDDEDYSNREYEATCKNIEEVAKRIARKHGWDEIPLPEDYVSQLWDALPDRAKESRDDEGGYPSDSEMEEAFVELEWLLDCEECGIGEHHLHCRYCNEVIPGVIVHEKRHFTPGGNVANYDVNFVNVIYGGTVHPIKGWRFCSISCYIEGYDGKRKSAE